MMNFIGGQAPRRLPVRLSPYVLLVLSLYLGHFSAGCGSSQNTPPAKSSIRYEPPPELPPYEQEPRADPVLALEALEAPENAAEASGGVLGGTSEGSGGASIELVGVGGSDVEGTAQ